MTKPETYRVLCDLLKTYVWGCPEARAIRAALKSLTGQTRWSKTVEVMTLEIERLSDD